MTTELNSNSRPEGKKGRLYLIPTPITDGDPFSFFPDRNIQIIKKLKFFFVEEPRTARRFISGLKLDIDISTLVFETLNKDTGVTELKQMEGILLNGNDAGVLSEAGCPGIADPGNRIVEIAHQNNIPVIPLIGPSSIFLAIMASGFNGQNFAFHGYLPVEQATLKNKIIQLEKMAYQNNQTQIFMETPYRNKKLTESLINFLKPGTKLCIATDLTGMKETIQVKTIQEWRRNTPHQEKLPSIYLIFP